ncbi:hypothetical protein AYL99_05601 [Fonsecaea erecta]|uniref:Uncharacterized protein n=1 Tax=Fonsecaea erecta TaxID=1367422 RepID=A0A178ZLD1_9EURO|nr:hypothetical protein AYL99_05601 [Fonsecaea erecta]OAP60599.1 hypothetical protein AYL99_05601 [Fonsecaea erecta]
MTDNAQDEKHRGDLHDDNAAIWFANQWGSCYGQGQLGAGRRRKKVEQVGPWLAMIESPQLAEAKGHTKASVRVEAKASKAGRANDSGFCCASGSSYFRPAISKQFVLCAMCDPGLRDSLRAEGTRPRIDESFMQDESSWSLQRIGKPGKSQSNTHNVNRSMMVLSKKSHGTELRRGPTL